MMSGVSTGAFLGVPALRVGRPTNARAGSVAGNPEEGAAGASELEASGEQQRVQELKRIDASVRQHEAAHQAAGGAHAGGASFTYTRGPDGKNYAVAGEVPIDVSAEREPEATIRKMDTIKAAALAPSDPSPQDLRVAQQADAQKLQAQQERRREGTEGASTSGNGLAAPALAARGTAAYGAASNIGLTAGSAAMGRGIVV